MARARYWSEEKVAEAFRRYEQEYGRRPRWNDLKSKSPDWFPASDTVLRVCGSWGNAQVLAFGRAEYHYEAKDEDTALAIYQVEVEGMSLAQAGRLRGITGQALGRRIKRYKEVYEAQAPANTEEL